MVCDTKEVELDREAALTEAERRFRALPEITASFQRTDAQALEECLQAACLIVREQARPRGLYALHEARRDDARLRVGPATLSNRALLQRVPDGARVIPYLVTAGYTNVEMFQAVERDYVAYHFQHMLSLQLTYVAANQLHERIRTREGAEFLRLAILESRPGELGSSSFRPRGSKTTWDASGVKDLFEVFADNTIGVGLTSAGDLNPIYSLLGLLAPGKAGVSLLKT